MSQSKICPKCQTTAPLTAAVCQNCAHGFSTQFSVPAERTQMLPPASPMLPPTHFQHHMATLHKRPLLTLALIVVPVLCLLMLAGTLLARKSPQAAADAKQPFVSAFAPDAPVAVVPDGPGAAAAGPNVYLCDDGITMRSHVALALKDPTDLNLWQKTLGARAYGRTSEGLPADSNPEIARMETPDDTYTQDRMVQEGRIAILESHTPARVISVENGVARVEITEGVNKGILGAVWKYCLYRSESGNDQLYKSVVHTGPPVQRPDGSFYPMAGIDYPADATHPRGSINHEAIPARP